MKTLELIFTKRRGDGHVIISKYGDDIIFGNIAGYGEISSQIYSDIINRHKCNVIRASSSPAKEKAVYDFSRIIKDNVIGLELQGFNIKYNNNDVGDFRNVKVIGLNPVPDSEIGGVSEIDYTQFKNLRHLTCYYMKNNNTPFLNENIKSLFLDKIVENKDVKFLNRMKELSRLWISGNLTSLDGIENFENLTELNIYNCSKIISLAPINEIPNLKKLRICNCKNIIDLNILGKNNTIELMIVSDYYGNDAFWNSMKQIKFPYVYNSKGMLSEDFLVDVLKDSTAARKLPKNAFSYNFFEIVQEYI